MFSGALRRQSVVDLRVEHLMPHEYGVELLLPKTKTDQFKVGTTISIPFALGTVCPVRAIEHWRRLAGVDGGYLFRQQPCASKSVTSWPAKDAIMWSGWALSAKGRFALPPVA